MVRPEVKRFEVFVRVDAGGEPVSFRVPDVFAADGKEALRRARAVYGRLAVVRGIEAVQK